MLYSFLCPPNKAGGWSICKCFNNWLSLAKEWTPRISAIHTQSHSKAEECGYSFQSRELSLVSGKESSLLVCRKRRDLWDPGSQLWANLLRHKHTLASYNKLLLHSMCGSRGGAGGDKAHFLYLKVTLFKETHWVTIPADFWGINSQINLAASSQKITHFYTFIFAYISIITYTCTCRNNY